MAIPKKLQKLLNEKKIKHEILRHKTVYTAFDLAQTLGKKVTEVAKTLALKADKRYILVVLPASHRADLKRLAKLLKVKKIDIIKETEMSKVFKVKPGAIVPFGSFHGVPVYLDKSLLRSKVIIASAGTFTESLRLKTKDLLLAGAEKIESFSKPHKFSAKVGSASGGKKSKAKKVKKAVKRTTKPVRKKKK